MRRPQQAKKKKGMFTVMKETCRKAIAVALCSVLSFGVVSTVMMEPVSAASHHGVGHGDRGLARMNDHQKRDREFRERQRREEEQRRERERRERERREREHRSNRGHSQGEVNTAAIVGAVIGAVIAKNT